MITEAIDGITILSMFFLALKWVCNDVRIAEFKKQIMVISVFLLNTLIFTFNMTMWIVAIVATGFWIAFICGTAIGIILVVLINPSAFLMPMAIALIQIEYR